MCRTLQSKSHRILAFILVVFGVLSISFAFSPQQASAAAITLSTATTSSSNASTTLAKVGDTVSYRLVLSGTPAATSSPVINIFNMGTTSMSGSGTTWTYSTTSASSWTEGAIAFNMAWGGTVGEATTTITQSSLTNANVRFDRTVPTISTLTSNATASGALKVGNTITFTLTPGATEYGASVVGSYNSQSLTWSTANSGATFTATYTVTEGETDRSSALQISSVVITDAAGNASSAGAGSDIVKTIDANSPATPTASLASGSRFSGSESITLSSGGSDSIRYTTDDTVPTCLAGALFLSLVTISDTDTIRAVGCDTAGNTSAIATFTYTRISGGGGGGGRRSAPATVSPTPFSTSNASGLGATQIESILGLLRSFGADTTTIAKVTSALNGQIATSQSITRDLWSGTSGEEVRELQKLLNSRGFVIVSSGPGSQGNETTYFGALTQAALAKFQAANGISPASGYFGPKTRAFIYK